MSDAAAPDLSTVTFDEIVEELNRRCDGLIVALETDRTADETEVKYVYRGGFSRCLGLSFRPQDWMRNGGEGSHAPEE